MHFFAHESEISSPLTLSPVNVIRLYFVTQSINVACMSDLSPTKFSAIDTAYKTRHLSLFMVMSTPRYDVIMWMLLWSIPHTHS